jgi:predicted GNAT family acetyltransferase
MTPDLTDIFVNHNIAQNRFEVDLGREKAILIYMIKAGLFVILHTEVPPQFEGRGIAGKMAKEALQFAAREGLKVRSYCTFTTRYIERHPEYHYLEG